VVVAEPADGVVVGWGATRTHPLGELLTDLFVDPAQHGRGIGRALLERLWPDPASGGRFTFSSQHANALPLYARAGLLPTWPLLYLSGPTDRLPATDLDATPVDAASAAGIDAHLAGGDRGADYAFWTRHAQAVRIGSAVDPVGIGVVRTGEVLHLVARESDAIVAALRASGAATVTACVPGRHPVVPVLLTAGFRITDYDIAMSTPDVVLPPTWVYSPGLA
jgi:hypothetical protein